MNESKSEALIRALNYHQCKNTALMSHSYSEDDVLRTARKFEAFLTGTEKKKKRS
jgi:hypothetical protein